MESILEAQRSLEAKFSQRFLELDTKLKAASPHAHPTISSLSKEVSNFKDDVSAILGLLRQQILVLSQTVDAIEMRHRRKHLVINGLPEVADEDVVESVTNICQSNLGLPDVTRASISICHRLGSSTGNQTRPVLVQFCDVVAKNAVWARKTALKGSRIVISEFLTKQRSAVFKEARTHFGMHKVWTRDGNIFIKLANGRRERVTTAEQLQALCAKHTAVSTDAASTPAPSSLAPASEAGPAEAPVPAPAPALAPPTVTEKAAAATRKPEDKRTTRR